MLSAHTDQKILMGVLVAAGLVTGAAAGWLGSGMGGMSPQLAGERVAETVTNATGTQHEVVSVERDSGMYRVELSANGQLRTFYVSEDGSLYTNTMSDLEQVRDTLRTQSSVNSCLREKDAVLYGNLTQQATAVQIRTLGGAAQVSSYYRDVNNPAILQEAVQRGVTTVPTLYLDNRTLEDVNSLDQISSFAGCEN